MSKLSKNIFYNFSGQGLLLVLGFFAVKYIFRQLGEDALGVIYFTAMMNTLIRSIMEMGICATTVREVSAYYKSEPHYISDFIRTASLFYWSAYILIGIGIYYLAPFIAENWIKLKTMDVLTATHILRILGIASFLGLPKSFYVSLFRGIQRMEFNNLIDVFTDSMQQFGTILILVLGGNLFFVVYWFAACYWIRIIIYIVVSIRFFSVKAIIPGYSPGVIKRNISFSSRMMSVSVTASIHDQADKLIISKVLPISEVGYYSIAYGSVSKATLITGAVAQAAYPSFSELSIAGNNKRLISQYRKLQDLLCYGIVPIFAIIPFSLIPIFSYILNPDTARLLLLPTTFIAIGYYMNGTLNIPYVFSLAVGKPGIAAKLNFYALPVVLPITAILIYFFGLTGAGLSWVFYHIFAYAYGVPRICTECLELKTWDWYWHVLRIFFLVGLTYGVAWIILSSLDTHSILASASAYLIASLVFLTGSYFMVDEGLRETLFCHLQMVKKKLWNFA